VTVPTVAYIMARAFGDLISILTPFAAGL